MRQKRHQVTSVVAAFLLTAGSAGAQDRGAIITGTVSAEDGRPLAGAAVTVVGTGAGALTNQSGSYRIVLPIERQEPSTATLSARLIGYRSSTRSIALAPGTHTVDFTLTAGVSLLSETVITGYADRQLLLDAETGTGSRLGLTARETPAIVDILSQQRIQDLGARTNVEALNRAPGVTSSLTATSPGLPVMRGFAGGGVGLFYDGTRVATPGIFSRRTDSWLYERIEILKGPASVLYGEGALAGAINLVPKRPRFDVREASLLTGYGSFGTGRLAGDVNVPIAERLAVRGVASYGRSDGYVNASDSDFLAASVALAWRPTDRLSVDVAVDHGEDDYDVADYGAPLVPRSVARDPSGVVSTPDGFVIDRALRNTNFNVTDAVLDSETRWLRSGVKYELDDRLTLGNEFSAYRSDRGFVNAEIFAYVPASGLISRSTGIITHDIDYWIERPTFAADFPIGGHRSRVTLGAEVSELDFSTRRYFGTTTAVDPFDPDRGEFPGGSGAPLPPPNSRAEVRVASLFGEEAFNLTPRWLLVGGARYDRIDLDRVIDAVSGPATTIDRSYDALSWRVGTVYDLRPRTQLFAQYSTAITPVGNFLLLSLTNSQFDLSTGASVEAGVKSSFWDDRVDVTVAAYHIAQDDIVTRDPNDPTLSIQGGSQSARGAELSLSAALTSKLRVDGNYTVLDARFDELTEADGANRAGRTPPRTPETVANLFAFYSFERLPVTTSAGFRQAGRFFTDNANTIRADGYVSLDAALSYRLPFGDVTVRGRNLTDEFYVDYTDVSTRQFQVAAPRSVDVTFTTRFGT